MDELLIIQEDRNLSVINEIEINESHEESIAKEDKENKGDKKINKEVAQISRISFGLLSPREIAQLAACQVDNTKFSGRGSVYDLRMGTIEEKKRCETCNETNIYCPGHFGYIKLNKDVLHPLSCYRKFILKYLKIYCMNCYSMLISPEQFELMSDINDIEDPIARFDAIVTQCCKVKHCFSCNTIPPSFTQTDGKYYYVVDKKKDKTKHQLPTEKILKIICNISPESLTYLGVDNTMMHPENFIIRNLPVCPPSARPYVTDGGKACDDDLTLKYIEIVKLNIRLKNEDKKEFDQQRCIQQLEFAIKTIMDNSDNKAKHSNGRPVMSIKQRINGKGKLLRNNLTGKRVDFSGRTVAGPDPTLRIDQIGIPYQIMNNFTTPHIVNKFNIAILERSVNDGTAVNIIRNGKIFTLNNKLWTPETKIEEGDLILRGEEKILPNKTKNFTLQKDDKIIRGDKTIDVELKQRKEFKLRYGDTVEVKYKDGDSIIVNRQPSLHRGSMMAFKCKGIAGKTIRTSLAVANSFNLDYDGDELNLHVPQDYQARIECETVCNIGNLLMSGKSNNSSVCIVQDGLIGSYIMTKYNETLEKCYFFDITMKLHGINCDDVLSGILRYKKVMLKHSKFDNRLYTSRCLWSLVLPSDFCYTKGDLKIEEGIVHSGILTKGVLSKGHNGLIQTIHKEYGKDVALNFVSNVQFVTDAYMINRGFSVGLKDCYSDRTEIKHVISECIKEADSLSISDPYLKEIKINNILNKARDIGIKIATNFMDENNSLRNMVESGSKGDFVNIAQISGLLGQQNVNGTRIKPELSNGLRTSSHYDFKNNNYESRGFVSGSFSEGLNPRELFYHAATGREGLVTTAVKTATSGYISRRMMKLMEDYQVNNDLTVRTSLGDIVQFNYGDDNFDPSKLLMLNGKLTCVNIGRLVDKLNRKYEKEY